MVDAEKSGVMFTRHPSTGGQQIIVEAAWRLGEAVVSGTVSPDHYVIDPETAAVVEATIADKKQQMVKDTETGQTAIQSVPDTDRTTQVITDAEIERLVELGQRVETHYDSPQNVEWAILNGEVFMLQSRPITTISEPEETDHATANGGCAGAASADTMDRSSDDGVDDVLVRGVSASPGTGSGAVRIIKKLDHLDQVTEGDIIVSKMTMPDMVPAMKGAGAIVTDEGGMTSHASIVSREMGVPAVVGTRDATQVIETGRPSPSTVI
jgi:pyruvate,water dikinase